MISRSVDGSSLSSGSAHALGEHGEQQAEIVDPDLRGLLGPRVGGDHRRQYILGV